MSNENITYLTDAVLITAVAPLGRVDDMVEAALDVGATGVIAHQARGLGARERLGILSIAVEAEKEVLNIVVAAEHQELVATAMYRAGGFDSPGSGYLSITALEKVATFIPKDALDRLSGQG